MSRLSQVAKGNKPPKPIETNDTDEEGWEEMAVISEEDGVLTDDLVLRKPLKVTPISRFESGLEGVVREEVSGKTLGEVVAELASPLDPSTTKTREGFRGKQLTYLEWHQDVVNLNRIFGYGEWSVTDVETVDVGAADSSGYPAGVRATVTLQVAFPSRDGSRYGHDANYTDVGVAEVVQSKDSDGKPRPRTFGAYEMAVKSAKQDAFKRAAANLGDQFGLSLYGGGVSDAEESHTHNTGTSTTSGSTSSSDDEAIEVAYCQDCNKEIRGYSKNGKTYTTADLVRMSKKYAGGVYCYNCKQKHN